jgi:hypothetical protein
MLTCSATTPVQVFSEEDRWEGRSEACPSFAQRERQLRIVLASALFHLRVFCGDPPQKQSYDRLFVRGGGVTAAGAGLIGT